MELSPRQRSFIKEEMKREEEDEERFPSARKEADQIREQIEKSLTE